VTTSPSSDSLTALRALLARSSHLGSLTEIADTLVPERRHVLLRRAAIPVVFDEGMVRDVLLPNLPAIPDSTDHEPESDVGWLLGHSDIERVGGALPLFRMRADMRAARLEKWFAPNEKAPGYTDAVTGVSLSQAIVAHLSMADGAPRGGWEAEQLYHLAFADPDRAGKRLDEMYRAADAEFDVPACFRVLQTIGI